MKYTRKSFSVSVPANGYDVAFRGACPKKRHKECCYECECGVRVRDDRASGTLHEQHCEARKPRYA